MRKNSDDNMTLQTVRAPAISRHEGLTTKFGCRGVYIIDESVNPQSRTFKDLRNQDLLENTRGLTEVVFVQITQGNSGYSMGRLAQQERALYPERQIHVVNIIPKGLSKRIRRELESCSTVIEMDLSKREISRTELIEIARERTGYSGPNVLTVENKEITGNGYSIIIDDLARAPIIRGQITHVVCPVGGGELAVVLAKTAEAKWRNEAPKIIGFTDPTNPLLGNNGNFVTNLGDGIADKLRSGYTIFFDAVKDLISKGKMELFAVSNREILEAYEALNREGLLCEPSAAAAFAGAMNYSFKPDDIVVIINTGRGLFDEKSVDRFWLKRVKRFMKNAGIALAGAVLAVSLIAGAIFERNRAYDLWKNDLQIKASMYFSDGKKEWLYGYDELLKMCSYVPGKKCDASPHPIVHSLLDFSDKELAYITQSMRWYNEADAISKAINNDIYNEWTRGTFDELSRTNAPWILRADRAVRKFFIEPKPLGCDVPEDVRAHFGLPIGKCPPSYIK